MPSGATISLCASTLPGSTLSSIVTGGSSPETGSSLCGRGRRQYANICSMPAAPYIELHAHSAFSFLDGASAPEELAEQAAAYGYPAIALTDHDGLSGSLAFAHAAKEAGVRPITGAELTLTDGSHLTLLAETGVGYANLCRLITLAHAATRPPPDRRAVPPALDPAHLPAHATGLVCLTGCARHGHVPRLVAAGRLRDAEAATRRLVRIYGAGNVYVELQRPRTRGDRSLARDLDRLAETTGLPTVATGDVHAHHPRRAFLQDAFVAIRSHLTLDGSDGERRGNRDAVLRAPADAAARFADHPAAVAQTVRLAERLQFDLTRDLGYRSPDFTAPGEHADATLARICRHQLGARYPNAAKRREALLRLDEELELIAHHNLAGFFLLHREILELAREVAYEVRPAGSARRILPPGRGRGSSVGSIVCYLTGLSHIDPVRNRLFLGRFLNRDMASVPDIDLDFPRDIRERPHRRDHPPLRHRARRPRRGVPDVPHADGDPGARQGAGPASRRHRAAGAPSRRLVVADRPRGRAPAPPRWRAKAPLTPVAGARVPRTGGGGPATAPLTALGGDDRVRPTAGGAGSGRARGISRPPDVQWDKDSCADAGFVKIDLLGLGMLSAVEECIDLVARPRGSPSTCRASTSTTRPSTTRSATGDTVGVFQIESRAQIQSILQTQPENLDDLTIQVALIRPGPVSGGAVHPYVSTATPGGRPRLRAAVRPSAACRLPS